MRKWLVAVILAATLTLVGCGEVEDEPSNDGFDDSPVEKQEKEYEDGSDLLVVEEVKMPDGSTVTCVYYYSLGGVDCNW